MWYSVFHEDAGRSCLAVTPALPRAETTTGRDDASEGREETMSQRILTARALPGLPLPAAGRVEYPDAKVPGLALRVSASGHRSWVVYYRHAGRLRRLTLGPLSVLGLADARDRARSTRAAAHNGGDPAGEKQSARDTAQSDPTFEYLAQEYLERHARPKKRSWQADERMLGRYVPRTWFKVPARTITRRQVRDMLDEIAARAPIQANRVLALLRKVWNFGIKRDLVEANPCALLDRPAPERQSDRVLSVEELRLVWAAITDEAELATAVLFKLYLWTAQRGGEIRSMQWSDIDLNAAWWVIPSERSKNKLAHRVPLSPPAVECLRSLQKARASESPWVFASQSKSGYRQIMHKAAERVRERSGVSFVPHDLRRTVATFLTSEVGVSRLVVSKLLNHVESGITRVYDRASYDREKRIALNTWAVRLDAVVTGNGSGSEEPESNVDGPKRGCLAT